MFFILWLRHFAINQFPLGKSECVTRIPSKCNSSPLLPARCLWYKSNPDVDRKDEENTDKDLHRECKNILRYSHFLGNKILKKKTSFWYSFWHFHRNKRLFITISVQIMSCFWINNYLQKGRVISLHYILTSTGTDPACMVAKGSNSFEKPTKSSYLRSNNFNFRNHQLTLNQLGRVRKPRSSSLTCMAPKSFRVSHFWQQGWAMNPM